MFVNTFCYNFTVNKKSEEDMKTAHINVIREHKCDVLVAGGGVSGFSAAVNAARKGADVILCEANGLIGGTATAGLVGPFMTCYDHKGENQIIKKLLGLFSSLL